MAKKKSKKSKFPDRGFATTSIPKRVVVKEETEEEILKKEEERKEEQRKLALKIQNEKEKEKKELEAANELLEIKNKEKVFKTANSLDEKRANYLMKAMDVQCSEMEKIPNLYLPYAAEKETFEYFSSNNKQSFKKVYIDKQKERDLNVNYLILSKLGFKDEHIRDAFSKAKDFNIDTLIEWLYITLDSDDIPTNIRGDVKNFNDIQINFKEIEKAKQRNNNKQNNVENKNKTQSNKEDTKNLNKNNINNNINNTKKKEEKKPEKKVENKIDSNMKSQIMKFYENMYSSDEEEEEKINDDVNLNYAKLYIQFNKRCQLIKKAKIQNKKETLTSLKITNNKVRKEMENMKNLSLFNKKRADILIAELEEQERVKREEKAKAEALAREQNKDGEEGDEGETKDTSDDATKENGEQDNEEQQSDDDSGGLFGCLENIEDEASSTTSSTTLKKVEFLDLKYKSWTGKSPNQLLEQNIRNKLDNKAKLNYEVLCRHPGYQCSVEINCKNSSNLDIQKIEMTDYHFKTLDEAKNYVALRMLYLLYPKQNFNVLVPVPFRNLLTKWTNETEEKEEQERIKKVQERLAFINEIIIERGERNHKLIENDDELNPTERTEQNVVKSNDGQSTKKNKYIPPSIKKEKNNQYKKYLEKRKELPIFKHRERILETLRDNQVLLIAGETGSGKSTQIPQFIIEDMEATGKIDECNIICTQPRRISAISIASRVSLERGEKPNELGKLGSYIGYQVRLNSKISKSTKLLFCTVGILLRRFENSSDLNNVTHIIVDEVHERSMDCDFLLIILKQLMKINPNIK